jgi:hypothetical protein
MAKVTKKASKGPRRAARPSKSATIQIVGAKTDVRTVRFGTVTATVARVDRRTETRNIRQGQAALRRASKTLAKPGVAPIRKKGVPSYHSDPKVKGHVVCVMNGTKTSGVFDDRGVFKATVW